MQCTHKTWKVKKKKENTTQTQSYPNQPLKEEELKSV